jgi:hypothetical protein
MLRQLELVGATSIRLDHVDHDDACPCPSAAQPYRHEVSGPGPMLFLNRFQCVCACVTQQCAPSFI